MLLLAAGGNLRTRGSGSPFGHRLSFGKGAPGRAGEAGFTDRAEAWLRRPGRGRLQPARTGRAGGTKALCARGRHLGLRERARRPPGPAASEPRGFEPAPRPRCPFPLPTAVLGPTRHPLPSAPRAPGAPPGLSPRPRILRPPVSPCHQPSRTGPPPPPMWAAPPHPRAARALTSAATPRGPRRKITGAGDGGARPRSPFAKETARGRSTTQLRGTRTRGHARLYRGAALASQGAGRAGPSLQAPRGRAPPAWPVGPAAAQVPVRARGVCGRRASGPGPRMKRLTDPRPRPGAGPVLPSWALAIFSDIGLAFLDQSSPVEWKQQGHWTCDPFLLSAALG